LGAINEEVEFPRKPQRGEIGGSVMPQSLAKVAIHIVYSTKHRTAWLKEEGIRRELYAYMATVLKAVESPAILIGGVEDHVHILCLLSRNYAIKKVVEEVKTEPSKWIKKKGAQYRDFHWQAGYGVFSVSESMIGQVKAYIEGQEEHHRRMTFQEEFRRMCARHGVEIDERYVWD
jgi:putative transposase